MHIATTTNTTMAANAGEMSTHHTPNVHAIETTKVP